MDRDRILHLVGALRAGGAERFVVDLLCEMSRQGRDVSLVCLSAATDSAGDGWAERLAEAGVDVRCGPTLRIGPRTVWWLRQELTRSDIKLVHLHLYYVEQVYALARLLVRAPSPMVRTIHNTAGPRTPLTRWAFDNSGALASIACGHACFEAHEGRVKDELVCIPNGIDFSWPVRNPAERSERLSALGLDPHDRHFVHVGRQFGASTGASQKAHDDLIAAWLKGGLGSRGARLHLLGDGPLRGELERLAEGDESIAFHGVTPNVTEWLIACDVFVLPSRWEGLPIAAIEALGTGIPCIFSEIAPLREVGDDLAEFVEVGDVAGMSRTLIAALQPSEAGPDDGVHEFRKRHSIEGVAREHLALYDRLVSRG